MHWQNNPLAIPMFLSCALLFVMVAVAQRRNVNLPVRLFVIFALAIALMNMAYGFELLSADLPTMMIWLKVEYVARVIPSLWLFFVLAYIGHERWLTRRFVIAFLAIPLIWMLAAWTNEYHHFNWATVGTEVVNGVALFKRTYGVFFYVGLAYSYTVALAASLLLLVSILRAPALYRGQITWLVLAIVPPLTGSVLTTLQITPIPNLDLLPFGYALGCVSLAWSLFRYQLLDITPRAYSHVVQSMPDAVIVLDEQRRIVYVNPVAAALAGHPDADDLVGLTLSEGFPDQQKDLHYLIDTETVFAELRLETASDVRIFEPRLSRLQGNGNLLSGYVIVLRDITGRKRAEEIIGTYAAQLESQNRELDAFSHTVAHDLKSPVSNIIGFSLLLMDETDDKPNIDRMRKNASRIVQAGYKMSEMIDGLLLLAQLRNSKAVLEPVDMNLVVQAAVDRYQTDLERRGVRLEVADNLPPVAGQALWLEEVFANLISNAIKYIGHNNPAPRIAIHGFDQGGVIRYEVQDNGMGISPADQARLFESFARFHPTEASGLGLGLSIVLQVIRKLGGEVGVESEQGIGSTFWFTLPASDPSAAGEKTANYTSIQAH